MDSSKIKDFFTDIKKAVETKLNVGEITERDRYILFGCLGLFAVVLIYLTVFSFSSTVSRLEKKVLTLETDLQRVNELKAEYAISIKQLQVLVDDTDEPPQGPLISIVEKLLLDESVDRKKFSIKDINQRNKDSEEIYNEKSVDVKITQVPLDKMIDVLYAFQSKSSNLKVKGLRVRTRFDSSNSVDFFFMVSTFDFKDMG